MTEIWRTAIYDGIVYEGLYKVSNLGRILSLNYRNTGRAELMKPIDNGKGYFQVCLRKNRETKKCKVHRLVAFTFLDNPENKPEVNHIDEDKTNNFVFLNEDGSVDKEKSNLEWNTPKENSNHGTRNERISKAKTKRVLQLSLTGELIREWDSIAECERNGFNHSLVSECCNRKRKTHKGFIFQFKD
jgi:hypothetical protein